MSIAKTDHDLGWIRKHSAKQTMSKYDEMMMQIGGKTEQKSLFVDERSLFEKLCSIEYLKEGFKAVKKNGGSPGIDGITIEVFKAVLDEELKRLKAELSSWAYKPNPVRRVEIQKSGKNAGVRLLGVPCVRDRVVHATLKILLEPIIDPTFSDNSYGFRPERSQRQAVEAAQKIVKSGKEQVVDIDLSKFFDRVNHDRLISRLTLYISDKGILRLIGMILRSGIMKGGVVTPSMTGTVQGSPLSPLLSNVVLDELDKELERRGLEFCRYADDCNIFVKSDKSAKRVMRSISHFIENKLKLVINQSKSKVSHTSGVKFLGMTIIDGALAISKQSIKRAMTKVKELTPRGTHITLEGTIKRFNKWYTGWANYYNMTHYPSQLRKIEAHFRRRLRARIVGQHRRRRYLYNKLVKRGVYKRMAGNAVFSNNGRWVLSNKLAVCRGFSVSWFVNVMRQTIKSNEAHPHWLSLDQWVKFT